jgi:NAD(P)-dependent dehydrogenase (short-subunit alcohol dehydrogenase family)
MQTLQGKRALVTGAAKGIGRAIALALARAGVQLTLLDIDEPALAEVVAAARALGASATAERCDVGDSAQISHAVAAMLRESPRLDILVNNAGVAYYGPTDAMTAEQWKWLLAINLHAPIQLIHELLPVLLAAPESHILNVSSILGLVPSRKFAAYQASKFALAGLSQSLRAEYARRGLGVTVLCPGFVRTDLLSTVVRGELHQNPETPPAWLCTTPEKVAARAIRAIRRNQGVVTITPLAHVLWILQRLSPRFVGWLAVKRGQIEARNLRRIQGDAGLADNCPADASAAESTQRVA